MKRAGSTLLVLVLAGAIAAAGHPAPSSASQAQAGGLRLDKVGTFNRPVYVTGAPGSPRMVFVAEHRGTIAVMRRGRKLNHPFIDIKGQVSGGFGERGLQSIAFPPDYQQSRRFYVYYTRKDGDNELDEFKRSASDPGRALASSRRLIIRVPHPSDPHHNGGQLQFGPDRRLYVSTGDGGSTPNAAAHLGSLLGKILRIDPRPRGNAPYTVPPGNPYVGHPGRDEIFAYGFRNPWRFSFDGRRIAIGDVGESQREEVDYLTMPAAKGANFGWPAWEGDRHHEGEAGAGPPTPPIFTYGHAVGRCAIIGGYVVHDPRLRSVDGRYLYTDLCKGVIRSLVPGLSRATHDGSTGLRVPSPTSFGEGRRGHIYISSLAGPVYRLKAR